jgi:hypothetical protein
MTALDPAETRRLIAGVVEPLAPWDGRCTVAKPADYIPGLYRIHQLIAFDLLRSSARLTNWEAALLQTVAYRSGSLSELQSFWFNKVERDHTRCLS